MIFPYQQIISVAPDGDDYQIVLRPEIPVTLVGPSGRVTFLGLVDTGSDNTIFPKTVADRLGIPLEAAPGAPATVFGGQQVQLLVGEAIVELETDGEVVRWSAQVFFFDFSQGEDETVILGHRGFLDYFTATFDGKQGMVTLVPNDEMPLTS